MLSDEQSEEIERILREKELSEEEAGRRIAEIAPALAEEIRAATSSFTDMEESKRTPRRGCEITSVPGRCSGRGTSRRPRLIP